VVDDEADFVELIAFNLREHGYEVITASNGLDALFKARRFLPDLIVLDLMMEGVDGYSACEILRCQPSTKDIPVVMVTAAVGQLARINGLAVGATEFFQKPVSMTVLLQRVDAILKADAARRSRELSETEDEESPAV
jgi:DNA-binding response OmpR family regulator